MTRILHIILPFILLVITASSVFSMGRFPYNLHISDRCNGLDMESELIRLLGTPSKIETIKDNLKPLTSEQKEANKIMANAKTLTWYQPQTLILQPPEIKQSVSDYLWNGPKEKQYYCEISIGVQEDFIRINLEDIHGLNKRLHKIVIQKYNDYCPKSKTLRQFQTDLRKAEDKKGGGDCASRYQQSRFQQPNSH